jgi:3-O-methyltransferase
MIIIVREWLCLFIRYDMRIRANKPYYETIRASNDGSRLMPKYIDGVDHEDLRTVPRESESERAARVRMSDLLSKTPIPANALIENLSLYLRRRQFTDILSMDSLYRMIIDTPGVIMEFGVLYGRHLATFTTLRGIYEPYSPLRRVVGFDTFSGLPEVSAVDGVALSAVAGKFMLPPGYRHHLREVLDAHEETEPCGHIRRTILVEGDVRETLSVYLRQNPQTIIALAYFDLDIYEPTLHALDTIRPYLTRGSVLAFDELGYSRWPGETVALREALGFDHGSLRQLPGREPPVTYLRWE